MKIAIVGAGNIGGTLGTKWAAAGHEVAFGVRDPASPKIGALLEKSGSGAAAFSVEEAVSRGEVVLLAAPWSAIPEIVEANAKALDGKVVVDATNNFGGPVINNILAIQSAAPFARVYRAFNGLGWEIFARPQFGAEHADLFYCGADGDDRTAVEALIRDIGLRPIWVGNLDRVRPGRQPRCPMGDAGLPPGDGPPVGFSNADRIEAA